MASENIDKMKALDLAMRQIEKDFGKGSIMKLGEASSKMNIEVIPTGALSLDIALGVGGIPRGRVIEIYGPESSGKTTVALHMIAEAQKLGGYAAFIDAEHALDPEYARRLGVDVDNLLISQPDNGEQALEIAEALVRSGAIDVLIVDSVAAMTTKAEIEGEMGDSHVGLQARLMSQAMRKLTSVIGKTNTVCVFINQLREKVGVMFGNPETTTGGRALKFYSSVRMEVRRVEQLKSGTEMIGNHTRAKIVKNKVAPPFREAEFDIMFGEGISKMSELIDVGVKLGIVQKSGAWFNYGDVRLGQGRDNAKQFLKDNPEIANDIEGQIRANADKLYASRRPAGKGAVAKAEELADGASSDLDIISSVYNYIITHTTRTLLHISTILNHYMLGFIIAFLVLLIICMILYHTDLGRVLFLGQKLAMTVASGRVANCLYLVLSSGLDSNIGLTPARELVNNPHMQALIDKCHENIRHGESFDKALLLSGIFSQMYASWIAIGSRTGEMESIVSQREINTDTASYLTALRAALRQINGIIYTSAAENMIAMDSSILQLYKDGRIDKHTAISEAVNPEIMSKRLNLL